MKRIVVVGASVAGTTAAQTLRRNGFDGDLVIIGAEPHPPYDRPPLSKQVLTGEWPTGRVGLPFDPTALGVELLLATTAVGLDVTAHKVSLDDGTALDYDGLVIATGVRPRRLIDHDLVGVHVLRNLDDALHLHARFDTGRALVILGGSFLGTEIAASATALGVEVTVVAPEACLLARLGPEVGSLITRLHQGHGVRVRTGTTAARLLETDDRVIGVELTDGSVLDADDVVVAIGSYPNTEWLCESGLPMSNGIDCDQYCRAAPDIVAAGDVASWIDGGGRRVRLEHRTNAAEQARAAASNLLAGSGAQPYTPVPYFWTDQYDVRVQVFGHCTPEDTTHLLDGDPTQHRFVQLRGDSHRVTGILGWNNPKGTNQARRLIGSQWQQLP